MATAPDRWGTEVRLLELLARQSESFDLDYKTILDIQNDSRHRLKLVKLVAAMTALSGDSVVGVDPRETPTGQVTPALARVYDEANLRAILVGYLPSDARAQSDPRLRPPGRDPRSR
jgi:hypothetical protein